MTSILKFWCFRANILQNQFSTDVAVFAQFNQPPVGVPKSYIWLVKQQVSSRWKTTLPFLANGKRHQLLRQMEDDLNFFENGRRPQFF